jgi:hypothetical protein
VRCLSDGARAVPPWGWKSLRLQAVGDGGDGDRVFNRVCMCAAHRACASLFLQSGMQCAGGGKDRPRNRKLERERKEKVGEKRQGGWE